MKYSFSLLLLSLCSSVQVLSQPFTNDWIDKTAAQKYFKIKVTNTGIYKIEQAFLSQQLSNIGVNISSVDPRNIQIFLNGNEQFIHVQGESNGIFEPGEWIEFYGQKNDGTTDTELYPKPGDQPHTAHSLFTDTAAYFLTWKVTPFSPGNGGKRFTSYVPGAFPATPEQYFIYTGANYPFEQYWDGASARNSSESYLSEYTAGEGFLGREFRQTAGKSLTYPVPTPYYDASGPAPILEIQTYGKSKAPFSGNHNHHPAVHMKRNGSPNFSVVADKKLKDYEGWNTSVQLLPTDITSSVTEVMFHAIQGVPPEYATDYNTAAYARIKYPRSFILEPATSSLLFDLVGSGPAANPTYIKFSSYPKSAAWFYDLTNGVRIQGDVNTGAQEARTLIPGTGTSRKIYLTDATDAVNVTAMNHVVFKTIVPQNNYQVIIITHSSLLNSAQDYAAYRSSAAGGGYQTLLVTSEELYDQFYYGLAHPLAIRKFCDYILKNSTALPEGLLLLGKGQANLPGYQSRFNGSQSLNLVPTIGTPPSDLMLTSGLNPADVFAPSIPIGRVPAVTNEEVISYLDKLKEYEISAQTPELWQKNMLHLAGGQNSQQNYYFSTYLSRCEQIVEDIYMGAKVKTYLKSTPVVSTTGLKGSIQDDINNGIGFMNYFGHGASEVLEINFGRASELNNKGKYPVMYYSGCTLGNSYDNKKSLGEEFLLTADKGAVGWFAGTALGLEAYLSKYVLIFDTNAFVTSYGKTLAQILQQTVRDFQKPTDTLNMIQCRQFNYQGDPMLRFYSYDLPDYSIDNNSLYISPANATALSDSFALAIIATNLGRAVSDSINISIRRTLPDFNTRDTVIRVSSPKNVDTIFYYMKSKDLNTSGLNRFRVFLDNDQQVAELKENNNQNNPDFEHFFPGTGVTILSPSNYGLVGSNPAKLIAQATDAGPDSIQIVFQIDTTLLFNSPLFKDTIVYTDFTATWNVNLPLTDSTVYYWRAKLNAAPDKGGIFRNASFMYIDQSSEGWGQGHYFQFLGVGKNNVYIDTNNRTLNFTRYTSVDYAAFASGADVTSLMQRRFRKALKVDNMTRFEITTGIAIMAVNPNNEKRFSYVSFYNQPLYYCNPSCVILPAYPTPNISNYSGIYYFNTLEKEHQDSLESFISKIPDGYQVFVINGRHDSSAAWSNSLYQQFETLGSSIIRTKGRREPYVLFGTKGGAPGSAIEKVQNFGDPSPPNLQNIQFNTALYPLSFSGDITSEIIGPAKTWKTFFNSLEPYDSPNDKIYFQVYGVDKSLNDSLIFDHVTASSLSLASIDSKRFPFLRLKALMEDSTERSPVKIRNWIVTYDPVPEGSINPNDPYTFYKDTLNEGDTMRVALIYRNTSLYAFDSVLVQYRITDKFKKDKLLTYERRKPLQPNDTLHLQRSFSTMGLSGENTLTVFVNPDFDQPEQNLYNNVFTRNFYVGNDNRNPILDVIVDGQHLMNGDLVSPNPFIFISLNDYAAFRPVTDPASITVFLRKPGKDLEKADPGDLKFTPASAQNTKATVEFTPKNLESGQYELVVSAHDASGNQSGDDYSILFEVDTRPAITNIYPYPNPFTSSMRFVFTLSGSSIPDAINIRIMTVTGRVVKEISKEDLGPIRIGNNISTYTWDGTDQFGDKLANGVYLYQVTTRLNGKSLERRETKGDAEGFKADVGKIYLMR
jgi:hypothetical protein